MSAAVAGSPAAKLAVVEQELAKMRRATPATRKRVMARAREVHRCPPGYSGPCWGPTTEDRLVAWAELEETTT